MPKIDQRTIESLELALPSLEVQRSIVREADRKLTLIKSLHASLELAVRRISTLRSAILSSAFSGKLLQQEASA
jgi:type I restriction enzyme S subunit